MLNTSLYKRCFITVSHPRYQTQQLTAKPNCNGYLSEHDNNVTSTFMQQYTVVIKVGVDLLNYPISQDHLSEVLFLNHVQCARLIRFTALLQHPRCHDGSTHTVLIYPPSDLTDKRLFAHDVFDPRVKAACACRGW